MILKKLSLALILASCSIQPVTNSDSQEEERGFEVVDWSGNDFKETIVIKNRPEGDYGPLPEMEPSSEEGEKALPKEPVVAIDLYPALYNSLGYVSTFVELENSGVNVSIVSSSGFSAVIAALYAKHGASNMVEWKTFELYQLLGDSAPFQSEWNNIIKEFLREEFGDSKLSQLKKLLVVPRLEEGKTVLDTNQKVVNAILESLNFSGNTSSILVGGDFDYLGALRKYGADEVMRVSFLLGRYPLSAQTALFLASIQNWRGKNQKAPQPMNLFLATPLKAKLILSKICPTLFIKQKKRINYLPSEQETCLTNIQDKNHCLTPTERLKVKTPERFDSGSKFVFLI